MSTAIEDAVQEAYLAWSSAFSRLDAAALKDLFCQDSRDLVYVAEENAEAMLTWPEIDEYLSGVPVVLEAIRDWRELARRITIREDVALVYAKLQAHLEVRGAKTPLVGEVRVSMALRSTASGWKIFHYHESRRFDLAFLFED